MSGGASAPAREPAPDPPRVGEPAPPLDVELLGGGRFRLADQRGRPFLVVFLRHAG